MAVPAPHKRELLIRNLPTRTVTLFPTRAHILREIRDVELQPGVNEIEISGLTPTTDEQSIKVEGTGEATITDMTVELVPNREIFQEVYPDMSDSDDSDSEDDDDDDDDEEEESPSEQVKALKKKLKDLNLDYRRAQDAIQSTTKRGELLSRHCEPGKDKASPADVASTLAKYKECREALAEESWQAESKFETTQKEIERTEIQLRRATRESRAEKRRADKAKAKEREKQRRLKQEKRKESSRVKEERKKFWPQKVYKVTLVLETSTDTPRSSRRSSASSITLVKGAKQTEYSEAAGSGAVTATLALSYVTSAASWFPRYDISFNTPTKSGTIVYRAEFKNETSETWRDAHLVLSTSQASFQGLNDAVPWMNPWFLTLAKPRSDGRPVHLSPDELIPKAARAPEAWPAKKNLLGFDDSNKEGSSAFAQRKLRAAPAGGGFGSVPGPAQTQSFGAFASFGQQAQASDQFGASSTHYAVQNASHQFPLEPERGPADSSVDDEQTRAQTLDFEASVQEDHGLTSTHEVPGARTLAPSSLARRHKLASLALRDVQLAPICVPKLRPVAFLRARFRNPSGSITLLRGAAGITLDGSYLGATTLPRKSPGELVTLPLGVDPAIHVSYAKPAVKRSTQGMLFNKESAQVFERSIIVSNTKTEPTQLLVLDQIPVSEDEKIRIDILAPRGLVREGDSVGAGKAVPGKEKVQWGKARATLKKKGEIFFDVSLDKGSACVLNIEYETKAPSSEEVVTK